MVSTSDFLHCSLSNVLFRYPGILISTSPIRVSTWEPWFLLLGGSLGVGRDDIFLWGRGPP